MNRCGKGCAVEQGVLGRRTTGLRESRTIRLHRLIVLEPAQCLFQDLRGTDVRRHHDPVMHPLSLAPCRDDARATKVSEVSGDLGLGSAENFDEIADANLLIAHQVQEAEPCVVAEGLEKSLDIE